MNPYFSFSVHTTETSMCEQNTNPSYPTVAEIFDGRINPND